MTVRARGTSWQLDITLFGTRIRETFDSHRDALARESAIRSSPNIPSNVRTRRNDNTYKITLGEALEHQYTVNWGRSSTPRTYRSGINVLNEYFIADTPLTDITRESIDGFIHSQHAKGNAPSTINRRLSLLSKALTTAIDSGHIYSMPKITKQREQESSLEWLEEYQVAEIARLLKSAYGQPQMSAYVIFLAYTGLRPGEGMRVKFAHVRDGLLHVSQTKSGKARVIPLPKQALRVLEDMRGIHGTGLVFRFGYEAFVRYWDKVRTQMGEDGNPQWIPYILRHTFASWLVQRGADMAAVRDLLGHSDFKQTLRYAKLAPSNLRSAVSLL